MRPRVTINDVAAAAGVSRATVSKYMASSGTYYVAEDTRERIASAIRTLGYEPNAVARSLSKRRSQTIGVIVPSFENPFYPSLMAGMNDIADEHGYTLAFASSDGSAVREARILTSFRQRQVEGVLVASVPKDEGILAALAESGIEVVLASRTTKSFDADTVLVDDRGGTRAALDHLVAHGHSSVWCLAGPEHLRPFQIRAEAYLAYCAERGLDMPDHGVWRAERATMDEGERLAAEMFAAGKPTAIVVANDLLALGVMNYCATAGISIPQDVALVGFDNVWFSGVERVSLTTVDGKVREIGRMAATRVLERIRMSSDPDAAEAPALQHLVIPTELVIRRSCGCSPDEDSGAG